MLCFYFHICCDESNLKSTELGWKMKCRNIGRDGHMRVGIMPISREQQQQKKRCKYPSSIPEAKWVTAIMIGQCSLVDVSLGVSSELLGWSGPERAWTFKNELGYGNTSLAKLGQHKEGLLGHSGRQCEHWYMKTLQCVSGSLYPYPSSLSPLSRMDSGLIAPREQSHNIETRNDYVCFWCFKAKSRALKKSLSVFPS